MNHQITARNLIEQYLKLLRSEGLKVSEVSLADYCYETEVLQSKEKLKIRVYFGAKGVKTLIQGDKKSGLYKKTEELIFGKQFFDFNDEEITEPEEYIGTDESGKGDYFGPLIIAGVLIKNSICDELKSLGVKDSKLVSDASVSRIADEIKRITQNKYSIVFISPAKYNELYERFANLNRLLAWGHSRAIENILVNHKVSVAVSDKFGDESLIKDTLFEKGKNITLYQYPKAEKYTAVAAASILARNELNKWFNMQSRNYNMTIPKGSSAIVENAAAEFIKKYGMDALKDIVKLHFKTTKKFISDKE